MNTLEAKPSITEVQMLFVPKDITQDSETSANIASFDYYSGIRYCQLLGIKQHTHFNAVNDWKHFIVCCGDVMVRVKSTDYPNIERRIL
jgi:hypothetical protein